MSMAAFAPARASPVATSSHSYALPPPSRTSGMSRGRQFEEAVENLPSWYFEYDEPKSGWHSERIHPLPEESSVSEPQDDEPPPFVDATTTTTTMVPGVVKSAPRSGLRPITSNQEEEEQEEEEDEDSKPPSLATQTSDELEPPRTVRSRQHSTDRRSSSSTRGGGGPPGVNDLVVSGYTIRGVEKRVMYHIDVRGNESQLQTYTIRRSYTDFKHLHIALSDILESRREHHTRTKAAVAAHMARLSAPAAAAAKDPRTSLDGPSGYTSGSSFRYSNTTRTTTNQEQPDPSIVPSTAAQSPPTEAASNEPWFVSFVLPPLPNAGFLSFWKRHDRTHVQNRCEMFQEILRAATLHTELRDCFAMQSFLSFAPCAIRERGSSYVSLCEYSVPRLGLEEETRERKKLARERRRNSSAHPAMMSE